VGRHRGAKGSRKKKSNRKAGGGNKGKNKDEQASIVIASNMTTVMNNCTSSPVTPTSSPEPFTDSIPSYDALDDGQVSVIHQSNKSNNEVGNHDDICCDEDNAGNAFTLQGDFTGTGGGFHNKEYEHCPSDWIVDEKQIIAAEIYLVKQLEMILLNEMDSKKCPVVWL